MNIRRSVNNVVARTLQAGIERGWLPAQLNPYGTGGGLTKGGLVNHQSGMGGALR